MSLERIPRTESSLRSRLLAFVAAWRSWRMERATCRALQTLSDEQLKDIGLRRLPTGRYDRFVS
jgi:uncharacterized protein YjiS (DUF1127 family)